VASEELGVPVRAVIQISDLIEAVEAGGDARRGRSGADEAEGIGRSLGVRVDQEREKARNETSESEMRGNDGRVKRVCVSYGWIVPRSLSDTSLPQDP
jgi:hypothetical protein